MPIIGQSGKPEDAGLDYRGGARVSDGGEDEDFFMLGSGVMWASTALVATFESNKNQQPYKYLRHSRGSGNPSGS
jgi:hypothetical protein